MKVVHYLHATLVAGALWLAAPAWAQNGADGAQSSETPAGTASIDARLQQAQQELATLRDTIAEKQVPISKELGEKQKSILETQDRLQDLQRDLDTRNMKLNNLRSEIKALKDQKSYASNLLGEYVRNLETKLHIAEHTLYDDSIEDAKLAQTNDDLPAEEVFQAQLELLEKSLHRLDNLNGGRRFSGAAVDDGGRMFDGSFAQIGPVVYFSSEDGTVAGLAIERLGSLEPNVVPIEQDAALGVAETARRFVMRKELDEPEAGAGHGATIRDLVTTGQGKIPLDATLGNARKIEETKATLMEHIEKGGIVMVPILGMAGLALLVSLIKWLQLASVRMPAERTLEPLLGDIARRDTEQARERVGRLKGAGARMLEAAIDHLDEPKELVEEVMYERMLKTKIRLNKALPFIAVCASTAPLLGLLGTVTGIINTFKLLTVFGSGDVKMLSSGISEALVTTEFGLIVAIPSLLAYAFLNRKAKSLINRMEQMAVAVMNQLSKTPETVLPPSAQHAKTEAERVQTQTLPDAGTEGTGDEPRNREPAVTQEAES